MSNQASDLSRRLEALEVRSAHQERLLVELNDVITAQWKQIDLLSRQCARLQDEVQNIGPARDGAEPPPPHY